MGPKKGKKGKGKDDDWDSDNDAKLEAKMKDLMVAGSDTDEAPKGGKAKKKGKAIYKVDRKRMVQFLFNILSMNCVLLFRGSMFET